jgi:hypothetical protein
VEKVEEVRHRGGTVGGSSPLKIASEILRRRKDNRLIVGLVLAVLVVWAGVSALEQRAAEMDPATITRGLALFVLS